MKNLETILVTITGVVIGIIIANIITDTMLKPAADPRIMMHPNIIGHSNSMMRYGMHPAMTAWTNGFFIIFLAISLVLLVDLIFAGIWLCKQIKKK